MATKQMTAVFLACGCHDIFDGNVDPEAEYECGEHGFQEPDDVHHLTVQLRASYGSTPLGASLPSKRANQEGQQ